jgi:alkylation response protein AidB-like acyl-CoA dehydrogenase
VAEEAACKGWIAPDWPVEYGGTGWSSTQKYIYETERGLAGIPDVIPFGLKMVAPVIYTFGTEEQKARFLPRILSSDDWWCQGYSEPGAGSDLAALTTSAEYAGDNYIVNGRKIWTTLAQFADWIFCLVRTSKGVRRQEGISFLLIDMKSPGITVKPIIAIDGQHSLNEVLFENVLGTNGKSDRRARQGLDLCESSAGTRTHRHGGGCGLQKNARPTQVEGSCRGQWW